MEGTVSAAALTHYVRYAESQGVETRALLEQSGLEALTFAESGRRLPVAVFGALLQRLIDAAGDPLFGVRSARHIQPGQYHVLEYMAMSCPTLGEVVERMPRYEPLVGDMGVTSVEPGGERVAVRWHCAFPEPELRRHLVDSVLVSWLGYVRWLTRREVVPVTVRLETDPRRNELAEAYREAWDGDLELDAEDNALVVPRSL
ncbi:MAG: AraC family transcriptional regulator, partial [Ectothiorhodospiraceae bacterium]